MTVPDVEILNAKILIVDDQPANLRLLEQMLETSGYTDVTATSNPREVSGLHRRHAYDLILLDLQMPGMDGFEVMAQLESIEGSYLPVLVLTAQPSQKLRALQAGAKDFVSKPFDVLEIQTRIRNLLEVRLLYKRVENNNRQLEQTVLERTAELRESEARFRSLVELASDWYWEQDENGQFTRVSGPAMEMLGLGEVTGEAGDAGATAGGWSGWNEADRASLGEKLAMRRPFIDFVYRRTRSDGSEQFLQTSGEPKFDEAGRFRGYRGIGMDVTGRMAGGWPPQASSLRRFRDAMDSTAHGIFLLDRSSMRFVDANATACRLTGYSREELLSRGPGELHPDPGHDHAAEFDQMILAGPDPRARNMQLLRKDGSLLPVEVHRQASRTESGWLLVEVVRELTEAA